MLVTQAIIMFSLFFIIVLPACVLLKSCSKLCTNHVLASSLPNWPCFLFTFSVPGGSTEGGMLLWPGGAGSSPSQDWCQCQQDNLCKWPTWEGFVLRFSESRQYYSSFLCERMPFIRILHVQQGLHYCKHFVYVIAWFAVQFGNCMSKVCNFTRWSWVKLLRPLQVVVWFLVHRPHQISDFSNFGHCW